MKLKLKSKILGLSIAFIIGVFLSSILSFCLVKIFTRVPLEILEINVRSVIENITLNNAGLQLFVLIFLAFTVLMLVSVFKVFDLDDYFQKLIRLLLTLKFHFQSGKIRHSKVLLGG